MKNFKVLLGLLMLSFLVALTFSSCKDDPVTPEPEPEQPEYVIIKVKAVAENLASAWLFVPALDIDGRLLLGENTNEILVGFPYEEFYSTTQLIRVRIMTSINGDGKAPYNENFLEQYVFIDRDKTIVFAL